MDLQAYVIIILWFSLVFNNYSKVYGNAEGEGLYAFTKQLSDPDDYLRTWKSYSVQDPCHWEHVTCNEMRSIIRIDLGNSNLSGQPVSELGQLSHLEYLMLFNNHITGKIPVELGNLRQLKTLNLCFNQLEGAIPHTFGKLHNLRILRLNNNKLTGTIPVSLTTISTLNFIDVSNNNIHGDVAVNAFILTRIKFDGNPNLRAPKVTSKASNTHNNNEKIAVGGATAGGILVFLATIVALVLWRYRRPRDCYFDVPAEGDNEVQLGQLKRFALSELQLATDMFHDRHILGRGRSSDVYKGELEHGKLVAVKRLKREQTHWEMQFKTEIKVISTAVHRNLLRLIGYCTTPSEFFLIYPYMPNGSLLSWLTGRPDTRSPLDWTLRIKIAVGSARGLAYLHDHCDPKVIHRDVKAGNILLDEDFTAVVGDFGLAMFMDRQDSYVTTAVRGTIGYIAPEYQSSGRCSEKSDVFGYGMMLLELVTGETAIDLGCRAHDDDVMLRDWVTDLCRKQKFEILVDDDLKGKYIGDEVERLTKVALLCIQVTPLERPNMCEVVRMLEEVGHDTLDKRWEEWQKEEMIKKKEMLKMEKIMRNISNADWSSSGGDSICELPPDDQ